MQGFVSDQQTYAIAAVLIQTGLNTVIKIDAGQRVDAIAKGENELQDAEEVYAAGVHDEAMLQKSALWELHILKTK